MKKPEFYIMGRLPNINYKCSCGLLIQIFFPLNDPKFEGVKIACTCGRIYTFLDKFELTDCKDIENVAKNTTTN